MIEKVPTDGETPWIRRSRSPMSAKQITKRMLFGEAYLCESAKVALASPQSEVSVSLQGLSSPLDVTAANVICGLSPLLIGVGLPAHFCLPSRVPLSLVFADVATRRTLASIRVQVERVLLVGGHQLFLFRTFRSRRYYPSLPQQWAASAWLGIRRARPHTGSHADEVKRQDRDAVFAFYMCPRPLVLVSASDGRDMNIFPMDLMGPVAPGWATFALKTDKPVVDLLRSAGGFVVASVPAEQTSLAFDCGRNHRRRGIDPAALPFSLTNPPQFFASVPKFALDAVEYAVADVHILGSHTLFVARQTRQTKLADGDQAHLTMATFLIERERRLLVSRPKTTTPRSAASPV